MKRIYLDYNATTPLKPAVYEEMLPSLKEMFGNPSSIHETGRRAKEAIMVARERVAGLFHIHSEEIIFTSGGTEANNLALKGVFERYKHKGRHILTTTVEHPSILDCCDYLEKQGADISYLPVNSDGGIDLDQLKKNLRADTILVTIQAANNETGVLMPISDIATIAKERGILFHTDAVQFAGKLPLFLDQIPVDMVSVSSHKINGPKGGGALLLRRGLKLEALHHGGNQERKRRGGTENVAAIVGFGMACELAVKDHESLRLERLRNRLEKEILNKIPQCQINGKAANDGAASSEATSGKERERIPNTLNVSFEGIEGEGLLLNLDLEGIEASSGSACSSGSLNPSHVLLAMGLSEEMALSSVRFSLGNQTTEEEIDTVITLLPDIVSNLRRERVSRKIVR